MHDELGQALTGLKMDTVWLERRLGTPVGAGGDVEVTRLVRMRELIDETVHTVRRLATELRPPILDDLGLAAAVQWQAEQFSSRTGIPADVSAPDGVGGTPEVNLTLFRVLQEALTNVVRHAGASRVRIALERHGRELLLTVADDGRGFAPQDGRAGALGLVGMRERITRVGGRLEVTSARGQGTTVTARVPA
jgi:signal transduction histidine kinase